MPLAPLVRRKLKKALVTGGLARPSQIVSHVNGSLTVMAKVDARRGTPEEQVIVLARKVKAKLDADGISFEIVKAGFSPKARTVFITVTNEAMVAQAGRGAHPGTFVVPAQGDREVYQQLFGGEAGVVQNLTEQVQNLPPLTEAEAAALGTLEASEA